MNEKLNKVPKDIEELEVSVMKRKDKFEEML